LFIAILEVLWLVLTGCFAAVRGGRGKGRSRKRGEGEVYSDEAADWL